jgi:hypothetical protein
MATFLLPKVIYRNMAPNTDTVLYSPPSLGTSIVSIAVVNVGPAEATFNLTVDGVPLHHGTALAPGETFYAPLMRQFINTELSGWASTDFVAFHISGAETVENIA